MNRSEKPKALPFQMHFNGKALPAIRKTGGVYMAAQKAEEILADPDFIFGLAQQVKQLKEDRAKLTEFNHRLFLDNKEVNEERDIFNEDLGLRGTNRSLKDTIDCLVIPNSRKSLSEKQPNRVDEQLLLLCHDNQSC